MAALTDIAIPDSLQELLQELSRRKSSITIGEGKFARFRWLMVANADAREVSAREALSELARAGILHILGPMDEPFRVRSTEIGRVALQRYLQGPDDPRSRWVALPDGLFHARWDADLRQTPLPEIDGIGWPEQLAAHAQLTDALTDPSVFDCTLRQLSARYFWGDSKYLESLPNLHARMIYGEALAQLRPRRLLIHVALGCEPGLPLLLIENLDTFNALSQWQLPYHLMYLAGFKGTADRMRSEQSVALFYDASPARSLITDFEQQWFSGRPLAAWFWGDLDYSAMAMAAAIRKWIPGLRAWEPGYRPLAGAVAAHGHPFSRKGGQAVVEATGIEYIDRVLLPAMRDSGRFIDQEWLDIAPLVKGLGRR